MAKNTKLTQTQTQIHSQVFLQRLQVDIALIDAHIKQKTNLNNVRFREIWFDLKKREQEKTTLTKAEEGFRPEALSVFLSDTDVDYTDSGLMNTPIDKVLHTTGSVAYFFTNALTVLLIPLQCYRERRSPTRDEGIKLALCLIAITLGIVATAGVIGGLVAVGFTIAAALITLAKNWQTIRIKQSKLDTITLRAKDRRQEIDTLLTEVKQLQTKEGLSDEEKQTLDIKILRLRTVVDHYIIDGHILHKLHEELNHPGKVIFERSMGFLFFVGAVFLIPPLTMFGIGIMLASSLLSITVAAVTGIKDMIRARHETQAITPEIAETIRDKTYTPKTPNEIRYAQILQEQQSLENAMKERAQFQLNPILVPAELTKQQAAPKPTSEAESESDGTSDADEGEEKVPSHPTKN